MHPIINFVEAMESSNDAGPLNVDVIESEESMEARNSEVFVIGEEKITPFMIDIKEVTHGHDFLKLHTP